MFINLNFENDSYYLVPSILRTRFVCTTSVQNANITRMDINEHDFASKILMIFGRNINCFHSTLFKVIDVNFQLILKRKHFFCFVYCVYWSWELSSVLSRIYLWLSSVVNATIAQYMYTYNTYFNAFTVSFLSLWSFDDSLQLSA